MTTTESTERGEERKATSDTWWIVTHEWQGAQEMTTSLAEHESLRSKVSRLEKERDEARKALEKIRRSCRLLLADARKLNKNELVAAADIVADVAEAALAATQPKEQTNE